MSLGLFFVLCVIVSGLVIRFGMLFAGRLGVLDHPGGHKQHDTSTPFVGGFGVVAVALTTLYLGLDSSNELSSLQIHTFAAGSAILFITGFADDVWHLSFKSRFVIQAMVASGMVFLAGVELRSLGDLIPGISTELGIFAVPFTIFATVGLINALNMIDGIDGLSGTLSFIGLGYTAAIAALAGNSSYLTLIIAVMGGVAGFLYYNLRYPTNIRARVFLGDNGSMLLGFLFAWLFIALSQGEQRAMPPVSALWIFGVPLLDTVSVMLRRIWMGKSPFHADRNHLHHLFIRAGFRVSDTVWIISLLQITLGAIGIISAQHGLPDSIMFGMFLLVFAVYFYITARPWRFVPSLRRLNATLALPSVHARGVFVGYFDKGSARQMRELIANGLGIRYNYHLSLHEVANKHASQGNVFALIELDSSTDEITVAEIRHVMINIKRQLAIQSSKVRLFMHRDNNNDRRVIATHDKAKSTVKCTRQNDRRSGQGSTTLYETTLWAAKGLATQVRE